MTEPRPHRPALSARQAADALREDVRSGRLAADAADAVLTAAGQRTPRETEILTLIARGASTRKVADVLGITAKTAQTHIERIYLKTRASSRSTATLFALQHGLLDSLDPLDL
jgi:DNA-binding NarL/FixJ family response regulator